MNVIRCSDIDFFRTYVSNLVFTVIDEKNADVMSYVQQYFHEWDEIKDGKVPVIQPGTLCRQDNKCVLTDDGWKISRRHVTEYSAGLRLDRTVYPPTFGRLDSLYAASVDGSPIFRLLRSH